jgi:hypothetical protein
MAKNSYPRASRLWQDYIQIGDYLFAGMQCAIVPKNKVAIKKAEASWLISITGFLRPLAKSSEQIA